MTQSFQSANMRFRAAEPEDVEFLLNCENDITLWTLSQNTTPYSRAALMQFIDNPPSPVTDGQVRFIVQLNAGEAVGICDLFEIDFLHRRAWCGIYIAPGENRRKGLATEALQLLANYARHVLSLERIFAMVQQSNVASNKLFARAGYAQCGTLPGYFVSNAQAEDVHIWVSQLEE